MKKLFSNSRPLAFALWANVALASPDASEKLFVQQGAGAVSRTLASKAADRVNARDFGAKCDNSADDTVPIKNAILSLGAGGGVVELPPGSCKVTRTLTISTPVTLRGAGRAAYLSNYATRLIKTGNFTAIEFAQGAAFGGLEDLTIDRSGSDNSDGVYIGSGRVDLRNVTIQNQGRYGLNIYDANASNFNAIQILGSGSDGLYINGNARTPNTNGMFFFGLDIRTNRGHGINVAKGFSNFFFGATVQGNGGSAVHINDVNNLFLGVYSENNIGKFLSFGPNAFRNVIQFGLASDTSGIVDSTGTNSWWLPGDAASILNMGRLLVQSQIQIGNAASGAPGYLVLKDTGASYALTLEGTGANLTMPIKSSGGGKLTLDVDALAIDATTAPALLNHWTNFGSSRAAAGYYKDKFGQVSLQGTIKAGATGTNVPPLMTLPAGYRPASRVQFAVATMSGSSPQFGMVVIDSDGNVYPFAGGNTEFSLDGIKFKTAL